MIIYIMFRNERGNDAYLLNLRFVSTPLFIIPRLLTARTEFLKFLLFIVEYFLEKIFFIIIQRNSFQFNCFVFWWTKREENLKIFNGGIYYTKIIYMIVKIVAKNCSDGIFFFFCFHDLCRIFYTYTIWFWLLIMALR